MARNSVVTIRRFRGNPLDPAALLAAAEQGLQDATQRAVDLYEQTTRSWDDSPPFVPEDTSDGDTMSRNIYARGDGAEIYRYLDQGFMRKVIMTENYRPKTRPGTTRSYKGAGGPVRASRGGLIMLPAPQPVAPRRFTITVAGKMRGEGVLAKAVRRRVAAVLEHGTRVPYRSAGSRHGYGPASRAPRINARVRTGGSVPAYATGARRQLAKFKTRKAW
jgi:hypothetical protein